MNAKEIEVGQEVFVLSKNDEVIPYIVTKIGRKFLYIARKITENGTIYDERKYNISTGYEDKDWGYVSQVFLSRQDIKDKLDRDVAVTYLRRVFGWEGYHRKLSIEVLRAVEKLVFKEVGIIES